MTPEVGETYKAKVTRIEPYGAFLEFAPGKDGLLHVSEIDYQRVEAVEDYMRLGDEVDVKIIEVDREGRVRFSRKALLPKPEGYVEREPSGGGGGDRGRRDDRGGGRREGGPRRDRGDRPRR
jgi:polyribonucleotide nucleotidyltransferase